jgi:pilus assembly protein Flp/PilA
MVQLVIEQLRGQLGRSSTGEAGQGMAEYGLILALVAVVVIVALTTLGSGVSGTFNSISSAI